jgi:hypothetical protein
MSSVTFEAKAIHIKYYKYYKQQRTVYLPIGNAMALMMALPSDCVTWVHPNQNVPTKCRSLLNNKVE